MVAKMNQDMKRERRRAKRAEIDKATNGYMINLAWGIFLIILLRFVESGYSSGNTVLIMPVLMKVLAGVFAVGSVLLFVFGNRSKKAKSRFFGYGFFTAALALGSLWIGFFSQLRMFFGNINASILNIDSRWWISRGLIVLIAIYLVVTLVLTTVKIALIEKGKKL